ncbi:YxeA family protein [Bacillus inaquosorum]|uniref:YxeA family protein n=1 Tax=Bacillus inaquosorum TaxID=483913 RepID=UPI00227DEF67|nr:YxeA family protein [Bacillus inaquosorum]MCY8499953.1 YxeA family protein [Bacillus inaquosorum]
MKKAMAILAVLAAAAVICGLLFFHNDVTDRFNPFIHQQDVYVQIDRDGRHLSPGGTEYTLDGYNAFGKKEEVTFFAGKDLRKDAYLKVKAKGKYVETWEEVRFEDMPDSVQSALK